jgi:hypothetical protein
MMLWSVGRPDSIAHRPDGMTRLLDGWQETEISDLKTVQNLLKHF